MPGGWAGAAPRRPTPPCYTRYAPRGAQTRPTKHLPTAKSTPTPVRLILEQPGLRCCMWGGGLFPQRFTPSPAGREGQWNGRNSHWNADPNNVTGEGHSTASTAPCPRPVGLVLKANPLFLTWSSLWSFRGVYVPGWGWGGTSYGLISSAFVHLQLRLQSSPKHKGKGPHTAPA